MCKQPSAPCLNYRCDGFAQILELIPCPKRPNCKTKVTRIHQKRSVESFCPDCRVLNRRQRKRRRDRERRAEVIARTRVGQQQAESSTMGSSKDAVRGGSLPGSDNPVPTREETEEPNLLPDGDPVRLSFLGNQGRTKPVRNASETVDGETVDGETVDGEKVDGETVDDETIDDDETVEDEMIDDQMIDDGTVVDAHDVHQQPETPSPASPTLTEIISSFNAELAELSAREAQDALDATGTVNCHNSSRDFATGPDATGLSGLPIIPSDFSGPSDQTAADLHEDATSPDGVDPIENTQDAGQYVDFSLWLESSDSETPSTEERK